MPGTRRAFRAFGSQNPPRREMETYDQIVIRGEMACVQSITETMAKSSDIMNHLIKNVSLTIGRLPKDTSFILTSENTTRIIIEKEPAIIPCTFIITGQDEDADLDERWGRPFRRSLMYKEEHNPNGHPATFDLAIPYSVYWFDIINENVERMYHGWRPSPLEREDMVVFFPGIPNIEQNFGVCMGPDFITAENAKAHEKIEQMFLAFWTMRFNYDLASEIQYWAERTGGTIEGWEEKSKEDPRFWGGWNFAEDFRCRSIDRW